MSSEKRKWISIVITVLIAGILTALGIYGIGQYGLALFILTPVFIGAGSTILYGYKTSFVKNKRIAAKVGFTALGIFTAVLVVCAIEGIICIAMAAPFGLLFTWIGTLIGYYVINQNNVNSFSVFLLLLICIPLVSFAEKDISPAYHTVTTSVEINAPIEKVWTNVVEFPQLKEPAEFLFKVGIAYPINARIEGEGVGAIRHCTFNTGSFVEPITKWNAPNLLQFDVVEQPVPMKELSFWDVDAPHLHDYFVSKRGQFKLISVSKNKTLLEGTTVYYHNIRPVFYWQLWSNTIVHKIHERVLNHIKSNSEKNS
ncbi:SRPBCC family protein [Cytophaga aurantiaca]|uniref:SRPBCC family protein n=1 Tax=Cytophaga aurantiaca TaxID=29530 RepID=UPI00036FB1CD|nr:SRPBCC family protein [Cytophaga aurantiaca]